MANEKAIRKWSELKGLKVAIPSEGRNAGEVEDFYFQPGTNRRKVLDADAVTHYGEGNLVVDNQTARRL